jgi:hypothetical protein
VVQGAERLGLALLVHDVSPLSILNLDVGCAARVTTAGGNRTSTLAPTPIFRVIRETL